MRDAFVRQDVIPWKYNTDVLCSDCVCIKTFRERDAYERELSIYKMGLPYVPALIRFDDVDMTITCQKKGKSIGTCVQELRNYLPSVLNSVIPDRRRSRKEDVKALFKRFTKDTGLYHNDAQYKNVLEDEQGNLFLIDFEYTSPILKKGSNKDGIFS